MRVLMLLALLGLPVASSGDDFWAHWGDGQAELDGYRLIQPRYGQKRTGTAVLVYVTEDMSDSLRVKADPGKHPKTDVYAVLKLNSIRHFQTGIYDYHVMTSTFARISKDWPVAKVSFSSQEWCGHVYHQLLPRGARVEGEFHSYFDGEADGRESLALPKDAVFEDALPILLRPWKEPYLPPGASKTAPFLPSLLHARLGHTPLAWGQVTITRAPGATVLKLPAGTFKAETWTVAVSAGPKLTFLIEAEAPYRLLGWRSDDGEDATLLGSTRLAYWKLNAPGGEKFLKEVGLPVPTP